MTRADVAAARPAPSATPAVPILDSASATHAGRVRERNEDRVHADPERGIFMVVDGIGGEAAGEKAAETAVEAAKSPEPKHIASSRLLDCAIDSTLHKPSAVSIMTSKPMRLARPHALSICVTSTSSA